jgi:hypothetical protein
MWWSRAEPILNDRNRFGSGRGTLKSIRNGAKFSGAAHSRRLLSGAQSAMLSA